MAPRYVELKAPVLVEHANPAIFSPRRFPGMQPPPGDTAPAGEFLKLFGFIFYTWDLEDESDHTVETLRATPVIRGYGYTSTWRPWLLARGLTIGTGPAADLPANHVWEYSVDANGNLVPEGTYPSTPMVQFRGVSIFEVGSRFDWLFCGHAVPAAHVAEFKSRSTIGTKVGVGLLNFESFQQSRQWNSALQPIDDALRPYVLTAVSGCDGLGSNAYGCTAIDKYEHDRPEDYDPSIPGHIPDSCSSKYRVGAVGCPHTPAHGSLPAYAGSYPTFSGKHTWDADVRSNAAIQALVAAIRGLDYRGYDCHLYDNVSAPYKGSAKNSFPASYTFEAYRGTRSSTPSLRTGWKGFLQHLGAAYSGNPSDFIWGNCYEPLTYYSYDDLANRWVEHFFRPPSGANQLESWTALDARIRAAVAAGIRFAINVEPGIAAAWATTIGPGYTYGNWPTLVSLVDSLSAWNLVAACALRSYIFHQAGMRPLSP